MTVEIVAVCRKEVCSILKCCVYYRSLSNSYLGR